MATRSSRRKAACVALGIAGIAGIAAAPEAAASTLAQRSLAFGYLNLRARSFLVPAPAVPLAEPAAAPQTAALPVPRAPLAPPAPGAPLRVSDRPPPGFEELSEPQQALVDVYFGGRAVGRADVEYTPETVRFLVPATILPLLLNLKDPERAAQLLEAPLPANGALICREWAPVPGCGRLAPAGFGAIFDDSRLRLDLFAGPELLRLTGEGLPAWLPAPPDRPSLVMNLGAAGSLQRAGGTTKTDHTLSARAIAAVGPAHVTAGAFLVRGHQVLDEAWAGLDRGDWTFRAGLLDEAPLAPLGWSRLLGASVATSLNLRRNSQQLFGTPLHLYLPRRAQVDILRDGRLISSRRLEAGNQALDTTDMPDGAYGITLRINDGTGVREEQRFYVKSHDLAPPDRPLFRIEAGVRQPNSTSQSRLGTSGPGVVRASMAYRLSDDFGVSATLAKEPDRFFVGPGVVWVHPYLRAGTQLLASNKGDKGATVYGYANLGRVRMSISGLGIDVADGDALATIPGQSTGSFLQASADLQWIRSDGIAGLRASLQRRGGHRDWAVGPYVLWHLGRIGDTRLDMTLQATRSPRDTRIVGNLTLLRFSGAVSQTAVAGYESGPGGGPLAAGTLGWTLGSEGGQSDQARLRADRRGKTTSLAADGEHRSYLGYAQGFAEHNWEPGGGRTSAGADLHGTLAMGDGGVSFGGSDSKSAAVLVELTGAEPGASLPILVDGVAVETARTGASVSLPLAPYRTYRIALGALPDRLFHIDSAPREVTLLPGNVVHLTWDVFAVQVLIGRIVDVAGRPIEGARVEGGHDVGVTGSDGWVQLEIGKERELVVSNGVTICRVKLPGEMPAGQVAVTGELRCH